MTALEAFQAEVERKRVEALARIQTLPVSVLVWGPGPTAGTPLAHARVLLRDTLRSNGHIAEFSEDLLDGALSLSLIAQQVAQAEAYDLVLSLPGSAGSLAEIHDFARIPGISHKIVAFLDSAWNSGYSNRSLIELQASITCQIQPYESASLPNCIVDKALALVRRLQELHYIYGGRRH